MPLPHLSFELSADMLVRLNIEVGVASSHDVYAPLLN